MAENTFVTVAVNLKVQLPSLPNFVRTEQDLSLSIGSLDDDALTTIGEEWTRKLIDKARKQMPSGKAP
jgi:hypothetical protein